MEREDTLQTIQLIAFFYQTYLVLAAYGWVGKLLVVPQGDQEDLVGGLHGQELQENGYQEEGLQEA